MKYLIFSFVFFFSTSQTLTAQAFSESTFHCISVYWSPLGGDANKKVLLQYSIAGANQWQDALEIEYNPIADVGLNPQTGLRYDKADYRGSIVDLTPNTSYDIVLTLEGTTTTETIQASTWNEIFPIGQTIAVSNMTTRYNVPNSGTVNAYLLIDGTGSIIDVQNNHDQCIRLIDKSYVILRGFTLVNARESGIRLFNSHHIIIEDCDISNWGEEDVPGSGFGVGYQAGVYAGSDDAHHCIIQRNKIHHPRWDTNSWAELHDPNDDPNVNNSYHPDGPQGIALGQCNIGNNVIRYNEIWSDADHYFNDILGMWSNASYAGFPGPDSDIYGNYLANSWDDGIESEGSNTNVRIWANYVDETFLPIANAATSVGPLYIWKNISGHTYSLPGSVYGVYAPFLKLGYANSIDWMTGHTYIFHNTILQPNGEGAGGLGTSDGSNRHIRHTQSRNNILHVRAVTTNSISDVATNSNIDYDYDLTNRGYPAGHEANGVSGTPTYEASAPTFDFNTKTGNFKQSTVSLGFDAGVVIPNFNVNYLGNAPDIGAHESGRPPMVFGVNSIYVPDVSLPLGLLSFRGENKVNFLITPNPAQNYIQLLNVENSDNIKVFDLNGILLLEILYDGHIINITSFPAGVYFLKINDQNAKQFIKN